jgi:hypothetical protein
VAKRNSRRGRSRKPRAKSPRGHEPQLAAAGGGEDASPAAGGERTRPPAPTRAQRSRSRDTDDARERRAGSGRLAEQLALGERPRAPWHPLPLSELVIFVGMIGVVVGALRGQSGLPVVAVGVLAVCIGTLDFTIREHLSGYRPHTTLLAAVPTALLHGLLAIALLALGAPSPSWIVIPIAVDIPVFMFLFRLLRDRFREARRERVFAAGR